jgi:glycosyltransferase involved in cell wall biosynthesis
MKISSITSLFKSKKFLINFVDQFYRQSFFKETEIILIDCNSDDEDYSVIKNFCSEPNVIYHRAEKDPGIYGAWNMAIKKATTPYITNSNTDDVKAPWYFETMYNYMEQHPKTDVVYGPTGKSSKEATPFYEDFCNELWQTLDCNLSTILVDNSPHCMPTWRKEIHDEVGYFDQGYPVKADFEFWIRCLLRNKKFDKLNLVMGNYYFNDKSNSLHPEKIQGRDKEHREIIQKHYKDLPPSVFDFYNSILQRDAPIPSYGKMVIKQNRQ